MKKFMRSRKFLMGASLAGLATLGCISSVALDQSLIGQAKAQAAGDVMVPWFEVDPYWPKPLPNHWILAMTIGLDVDKQDNVWIFHRPQTLEQKESYATRNEADCCTAAPDVLEFDPAGNLIKHWGRDQVRGNGHDWPSSNHGITIGPDGNVWLGGNGAAQPGPAAGSAAQFAVKPGAAAPAPAPYAGGVPVYHD